MDLTSWSRRLAARDLVVVPPSFIVPVQLWMLTSSGHAWRFRCRGTAARLERYAPDTVGIATGAPTCGCGCGATARAPETAGSVLPRPGASPETTAIFDGAEAYGWCGYEAGLLSVAEAAVLLDDLLEQLIRPERARSTPSPEHAALLPR